MPRWCWGAWRCVWGGGDDTVLHWPNGRSHRGPLPIPGGAGGLGGTDEGGAMRTGDWPIIAGVLVGLLLGVALCASYH